MTMTPRTPMRPTRPPVEVAEREQLIRVLRTQVHTGRYHAEPEQVAEQLVAWFSGVSA